jgi:ubiquinone/menaquinone biosynthesis C-methylase UbiE
MNNSEIQKEFYNHKFKTIATPEIEETIRSFYFQKISSILDPLVTSPKKFLEIACGEGILMKKMNNHFLDSTFKGIDISEKNIAITKQRGFNAQVGDAQDINLNEKFDVIYGSAFLHHLENIDDCFESVSKHLNENGIILFGPEPVFYQFMYIIWHNLRRVWDIEKGMMNISETKIKMMLSKKYKNIKIYRHGNAFAYSFKYTGFIWNFLRFSRIPALNDIYIYAEKK